MPSELGSPMCSGASGSRASMSRASPRGAGTRRPWWTSCSRAHSYACFRTDHRRWMSRTTCRWCASWKSDGYPMPLSEQRELRAVHLFLESVGTIEYLSPPARNEIDAVALLVGAEEAFSQERIDRSIGS